MSLYRTIIRHMAVSALTNNGASPWPTAAEDRVFDGNIAALDGMFQPQEPRPYILVETPVHENPVPAQGIKPGINVVELVFDIGLMIAEDGGETFSVSSPVNDSELDTALDLIELQMHRALASSSAFMGLFTNILEVTSGLAPAEDGQRAALRFVKYRLQCFTDPWHRGSSGVPAPMAPAITLLKQNAAYGARAQQIEAMLNTPSNANPSIRLMLDRKWSKPAAEAMGHEVTGAPVFPSDLTPIIDHPAGVADDEPGGLAP